MYKLFQKFTWEEWWHFDQGPELPLPEYKNILNYTVLSLGFFQITIILCSVPYLVWFFYFEFLGRLWWCCAGFFFNHHLFLKAARHKIFVKQILWLHIFKVHWIIEYVTTGARSCAICIVQCALYAKQIWNASRLRGALHDRWQVDAICIDWLVPYKEPNTMHLQNINK